MALAQRAGTEKSGGVERTTKILIASTEDLLKKKPEDYGNSLKLIFLDEQKNEKFQSMLQGGMSIQRYIREDPFTSRDKCESLRAFHQNGTRIEQFPKKIRVADKDYVQISQDFIKKVADCRDEGDFGGAVEATINHLKSETEREKNDEKTRVKTIAENVRSGEWSGQIIVEVHMFTPLWFKRLLMDELKEVEGVQINHLYSPYVSPGIQSDADKMFGHGVRRMHDPGTELRGIYMYDRIPESKEQWDKREKLLAARDIIMFNITDSSQLIANPFKTMFWGTKVVNRLDYDECEHLFKKMKNLPYGEESLSVVVDYLKNRKVNPISRIDAMMMEFNVPEQVFISGKIRNIREEDAIAFLEESLEIKRTLSERNEKFWGNHKWKKDEDGEHRERCERILRSFGTEVNSENISLASQLIDLSTSTLKKFDEENLIDLAEGGVLKSGDDLLRFIDSALVMRHLMQGQHYAESAEEGASLRKVLELSKQAGLEEQWVANSLVFLKYFGLLKTAQDIREYGNEIIRFGTAFKEAKQKYSSWDLIPEDALAKIPFLLASGLIKTPNDMRVYRDEFIEISRLFYEAGIPADDFTGYTLPKLAKSQLIQKEGDIKNYGMEMLRIARYADEKGLSHMDLFGYAIPRMVEHKVVASVKDLGMCGNILVDFSVASERGGTHSHTLLGVTLLCLTEAGLIKSNEDLNTLYLDLKNSPHLIDDIPAFPTEDLSKLKQQNFSQQLIELGTKRTAELLEFPLEKMTEEQKRCVGRLISGFRWILTTAETQILIKNGLENTYVQYYSSMRENQEVLKKMSEAGINTTVFVSHEGVNKLSVKKTTSGLERLETSEEQLRKTFQDVVNQMFNSSNGEMFKNPAKVFAEITKLDARKYPAPQDRARTIIERTQSQEEIEKVLSVIDRHLKSAGSPASTLVDSKNVVRDADALHFHIMDICAGFEMAQKPAKGEQVDLVISVDLTDKNPLSALTNGNDSGCCTSFGGSGSWTLPVYMKDMSIQIAEIFVKKEGKEHRIGQAWLFTGMVGNEPTLLIDSINIRSAYKNMGEVYQTAVEFVKDYAAKSGFKNVIMGDKYNDASNYAKDKFKKGTVTFRRIDTFYEDIYSDTLSHKSSAEASVFVIAGDALSPSFRNVQPLN